MNAIKETLERLKEIGNKAQFVSFTYCAKETGEVARHTVIIGGNYDNQIRASITALEAIRPTLVQPLELLALTDLLASFNQTLESHARGEFNPRYTKPEAYFDVAPGLKYCISTGVINVSGLSHAKVVLTPGVYKEVKSRPLTIAKNALRKQCPVSRWREYCVTPEHLESVRLQGVELVLND